MPGLVGVGGVVVHEHADHARQRAGHRDLARAQQRHALEADVARGDGRELRVEVVGQREDAAHERPRRQRRCARGSRAGAARWRRGSPRRRCGPRWWRRAGRTGAWRRHHAKSPAADLAAARAAARSPAGAAGAAPRRRRAELQRPEAHALERAHRMADRLAHPPDLALAALADRELEHVRGAAWRTWAGAVMPSSSSTPSRRRCSAPSPTAAVDRATVGLGTS